MKYPGPLLTAVMINVSALRLAGALGCIGLRCGTGVWCWHVEAQATPK
jgi:hypothetical protein